jgi:hypothetical protein
MHFRKNFNFIKMEDHLLRIATINYYDILLLTEQLNITHNNTSLIENTKDLSISETKQYFLEIAEELDSCNLVTHYNALSKFMFSLIINRNFNFLFEDQLENNFDIGLIEKSFELGVFEDLIKNLNYFILKFSEFQKK